MMHEVSITVAASLYEEFSADLPTHALSVQVDDHESLDAVI